MHASTARSRLGGLDGLRALAVTSVLIYHLFPPLLPGGYLGVDIFFSISGFLITTLLLREWHRNGRISLREFWRRRVRRLVPALIAVSAVSASAGLLLGNDLLYRVRAQIAGALFFVSNWVFISAGSDYFAQDTPELLRNTWSLAIEEQFYLALPLIVIVLLKLGGTRLTGTLLMGLGLASAWLMFTMSRAGIDPTRIYFGSDSHVFGLLLGAACACFIFSRRERAAQLPPKRPVIVVLTAVALLAFTLFSWLVATLPEASAASFEGGFQLATVASLAIIVAITWPHVPLARALDIRPLAYIGERSYGIYLWHWPILLLVQSQTAPLRLGEHTGVLTGLITLVLTLALAHLSHRFIETPIRRYGFRGASSRFVGALSGAALSPHHRTVAVTFSLGAIFLVPLVIGGVANAPTVSSAQATVERGRAALSEAAEDSPAEPDDPTEPLAHGNAAESADTQMHDSAAQESQAPLPPLRHGADILAIGDSVMLASAPEITDRFEGAQLDAEVSRGLPYAVDFLANDEASRAPIVVVGLGTNGPINDDDLQALDELTGSGRIILVNAFADRWWIADVNTQLNNFAEARRGVVIADWNATIGDHTELLAADLVHPHAAGGVLYADAIEQALNELALPAEVVGFGVPRR